LVASVLRFMRHVHHKRPRVDIVLKASHVEVPEVADLVVPIATEPG
jgi:hypothetical protein